MSKTPTWKFPFRLNPSLGFACLGGFRRPKIGGI